MTGVLLRLFRILPDELGRILWFVALAAILQAGLAVGITASDALFLSYLGADKLPVVFILMPLFTLMYAPLYSVLLARLGVERLFKLTLAVLIIGAVLAGQAVAHFGEGTPWVLYALKFYVGLWVIALYTLFWNFADEYFSILDGKRLYGLIAAGAALGAMCGAAIVAMSIGVFATQQMFYLWALLGLLAVPVLGRILADHAPLTVDAADDPDPGSVLEVVRSTVAAFRSSPFALAITAICFIGVALSALLEYLALGVIAAGRSPDELAVLLGRLLAVASALTLLVNLFVFNRLVGWLGVAGTALVVPLVYVVAFAVLFLQGGFLAALVAFYAYQSLLTSVEYNNINLLFNALPAGIKGRLRTFIEAMGEPLATALSGVFLLTSAAVLGAENIALIGLCAALVFVAVALYVRLNYVPALAGNLRADWMDFAQPGRKWSQLVTDLDRERLRARAAGQGPEGPASRAEQVLAVELLWLTEDPKAKDALLDVLASAQSSEMDALRPPVQRLLAQQDTEALADALLWLESERAPRDPAVLEEFTTAGIVPVRSLQSWRRSDRPAAQASAAVARWYSAYAQDATQALDELLGLLRHPERDAQRWAIRALGDLRLPQHASALLPFLRRDEGDLRLEALAALRKIATPGAVEILQQVRPLLGGATSAERALVLGIAERVGDAQATCELLWVADRFTSSEARQLESIIVGQGLKTVPSLIHLLRDRAAPLHTRSIAARALSRLATPQLLLIAPELIEVDLTRAVRAVEAYQALDRSRSDGLGALVLGRYYRDTAVDHLEAALELLSLSGRLPDFDLIRASLSFANARDRANAIETIQQSCPRGLAKRIERIMAATQGQFGKQRSALDLPRVIDAAIDSEIAIEATAGLLAQRELGLGDPLRRLEQVLDRGVHSALAAELVALLPRLRGLPRSEDEPTHLVERVAALLLAPPFCEARVTALNYIATESSERAFEDGAQIYAPGDPSDVGYLVLGGEVEVDRAGQLRRITVGGVFGERVLMGDSVRRDRAIARPARTLLLPREILARAIEVYPALGMTLYQFKTISAVS